MIRRVERPFAWAASTKSSPIVVIITLRIWSIQPAIDVTMIVSAGRIEWLSALAMKVPLKPIVSPSW